MNGTLLAQALLTGNLDGLPPETTFLFARAGLLFLFSAAGVHLRAARLVADTLSFPLRRLLREGKAADAAECAVRCVLAAWLAATLGGAAPLVRGAVVVTLFSAARLLELDADRRWILLVALLVSAVLGRGTPLSFAMSACALAGALFGKPRALGPWLFTLPLSIAAFGLFSPLAPLWALAATPYLGNLLLPLAIAFRLARALGLPLPAGEKLVARLAAFLEAALHWAPDGALWVRAVPWALLTLALLAAYRLRHRPRAALLLSAAGLGLGLAFPLPSLSALDVGQGDSIYLRTAGGELLEDVGPPGFHGQPAPAGRRLEALGRGAIDEILLSHFDLDHRGGLDSLLARHRVRGALWFREEDLAAENHDQVLLAAERAGVPIRFLTDAAAPPGLRCRLAPFFEGNDSCPLCLAELAGGGTALLTGDMSERAESWFAARLEPFPRADLLKVAHHGSRTSSSPAFLHASGARAALVSVGARNRYHHPSPEALARLGVAGMQVHRTDQEGSLSAYSWGGAVYLPGIPGSLPAAVPLGEVDGGGRAVIGSGGVGARRSRR